MSSQKGSLLAGMLVGLLIAASIWAGRAYISSRHPSATASAETAPPSSPVPDVSTQPADAAASVQLTDEEQKSIGVETVEVKRQDVRREIAAPGKVNEPETGVAVVSARISGRIDKLLLKVTGETVSRGQPVAVIYSPEVVTSAEEYRLALENRQLLSSSKESEAVREADSLVQASRRRLELWGLTEQQIEDIAKSSEAPVQLTTYSSMSGVVMKRDVSEGQYVKEGDAL
jgi:Cu(I)/Ag(I) efflux system membrane fusion protein